MKKFILISLFAISNITHAETALKTISFTVICPATVSATAQISQLSDYTDQTSRSINFVMQAGLIASACPQIMGTGSSRYIYPGSCDYYFEGKLPYIAKRKSLPSNVPTTIPTPLTNLTCTRSATPPLNCNCVGTF